MDQQSISELINDDVIPAKLAGKMGGWGSRAHNYPTFSPNWFRYRALSFLPVFILITSALIAMFVATPANWFQRSDYQFMFQAWLCVIVQILLGRWLAVRVYRSRLSLRKKYSGMILSIMFGVFSGIWILNFPHLYRENFFLPITITSHRQLYEQKDKDSQQEQRERISPIPHASVEAFPTEEEPTMSQSDQVDLNAHMARDKRQLNGALFLLLMLWWGGVADLIQYFRQRRIIELAVIEEKMEQYKTERNIAEMRLSVLASQVEPHFLFNTLSGVRSAMLYDPQRGVQIIDHLVDYLRATIPRLRSDGIQAPTNLGNQLDIVKSYLKLIHMRMPRMSFDVDCAFELLDIEVPPLMLISLVENAVKHGIEPKKGEAHITVRARRFTKNHRDFIEMSVIDDGVGFGGGTSGSGIGLNNIRERLLQMYGEAATLTLAARDEGGLEVSITIPVDGRVL